MGADNVIGITKSEMQTCLDINNVLNLAVGILGGTNLTYANNKIELDTTLTSMTKISSLTGSFTIASENEIVYITDENGNNGGADFIFQTARTNGGNLIEIMRLDGPTGNLGIALVPNANDKLDVNGDCNLSLGSNYKINGVNIATPDAAYNNGTNITVDTNNNISLDTDLISVNSISSVNNTDLKLKSTGDGDIILKTNKSDRGTGKIHLSRGDDDTVRFNTIEYINYPRSSYIKFIVHNGDNNTSTTDVLKLNGDGSSEFSGTVNKNNTAVSGYGTLEIGGSAGAFIDLKSPFSDDFDLRIIHENNESIIVSKSNLILTTNIVYALTIDTSQNSTFAGNLIVTGTIRRGGVNIIFGTPTDPYVNARVFQNISTANQDGMYINYGSSGGANGDCRYSANGITQRMIIKAHTGNVGIATSPGTNDRLQVTGKGRFGDGLDPTAYGQLQITRPATRPDIGHYISTIRGGNTCGGLGYVNSTNKMYIKNGFTATATNNGIYIDNNKVEINKQSPATHSM